MQLVLERNHSRKAFVIASDAFRFEAAEELARELNGMYRLRAELETLLGVLPSYTALGMASLLPHEALSFGAKGDVLVDGKSSVAPKRGDILKAIGGTAIKADELLAMKKVEGRAFVRPHRVIYIYHNVIDAVGDSQSTESGTFRAVRKAIQDLARLTSHIINSLNGSYVVITADHGIPLSRGAAQRNRPERPAGQAEGNHRR